jgi:hypothetical protein
MSQICFSEVEKNSELLEFSGAINMIFILARHAKVKPLNAVLEN